MAINRQTFPPQRIIVVDNASHNPFSTLFPGCPSNVELIRLEKNVGFARANNIGIRRARNFDFIALLNPDAYPEPQWLECLIQAAGQSPEFSFFASRLLKANNPSIIDGAGDAYHTSGLIWRRGHGRRSGLMDIEDREVFSPCAAAALYRTDILLSSGGFDESYFCYSEDVDLGFRLSLAGHRCLYVAGAVVFHVGSAVTGKASDFSIYHGHRNLVWTFIKNMPLPMLLYYFPQHLALNLFTLAWFALKGRFALIFKAKIDALKGLGSVLDKRKAIQRQRCIKCSALRRIMSRGFDLKK